MSWQVVNKILNRNKQSHNVIKSRFVKNGKTITDDADIAEEFNNMLMWAIVLPVLMWAIVLPLKSIIQMYPPCLTLTNHLNRLSF